MKQYDTIVVGGGLGGLTSGAILAKLFGKKVLLLEQHYIPGGCATTFKRKDFIMEVGLHEMDGLFEKDFKKEIFELLDVSKHLQFEQVPELFLIKRNNKPDFVMPHGTETVIKKLCEQFPEDEVGIKKLFKLMDNILVETPKFPSKSWKIKLLFLFMPLLFPNVVKASNYSLGKWLDKHIKNEELKLILQGNLLYYHDDPYSMSMIYFSVAQASYYGGGGHFIKGGSQQLSNYLAQVIKNNGGTVFLGKKVTDIIMSKGKACGVAYQDAFNNTLPHQKVFADTVIANAAIPLVVDMLPRLYQPRLKQKISHLEESCSLISIYIGFKKELKDIGNRHYSTFIVDNEITSLHDVKKSHQGSWDKKGFVFVDYSQIDSGLTTKGKSVGAICAADYPSEWDNLSAEAYKQKKEQIAQSFFKRLENVIPGITELIDHYEVGTSKTIQRYTSNPKGSPYGFAQTVKQSGMHRTPIKSPIKNLYFASAWTYPGGGFTGAIISGYLCALEVSERQRQQGSKESTAIPLIDDRSVKLLKKTNIAEDTLELVFEKPKGFEFTAGQYAVVNLNNPKTNHLDMPFRSLSICSHPDENMLQFTMRESKSSFKKSCTQMQIGDEATIYGPMGDFTLKPSIKNVAFIIGGVGITPIIPFLQELEKRNHRDKVYLFFSNKSRASAPYIDRFKNIKLPQFNCIPVFTQTEKRLDKDLLKKHLNNFDDFTYYIVGTNKFIHAMQDIVYAEGVDKSNVIVDDFG